jgi:CO dehydrogenase/acetyl-CoA synthase gamma subunit (corrinoid Fe-S protein)
MKMTLNTYDIADALHKDENANWSYQGAKALAEYLEDYEESTGEELELDVVAIRCDYSQYESLQEWAENYFSDGVKDSALGLDEDSDDDEKDDAIREYIQDNGQLIEFDGGIIVSSF